jgi:hypothetical protein
MLRHFLVTALIQSGVNMKVAQTLAGHHSAAFTLDEYADAVPQQLEGAAETVAGVLLAASRGFLVAAPKKTSFTVVQMLDSEARPDGLLGAARLVPSGPPSLRFGVQLGQSAELSNRLFVCRRFELRPTNNPSNLRY